MIKLTRNLMVAGLLAVSWNAQASDFFSGKDCPPWEYDCNDWPEWTPMYWMKEFSDSFDNNNDYWGYGPYGPPPVYGPAPYGPPPGIAPAPYGRPLPPPPGVGPAPAPYGRPLPPPGFAPAPYGRPPVPPAPYGRPVPPRPAPQQQQQGAPQGK